MNDPTIPDHIFYTSGEDAAYARESVSTPQTEDPAYRLAFQDTEFLLREDLRPIRFQLELLKPELLLDEANIGSTLVVYGSARIPEPSKAAEMLEQAEDGLQKRIAERMVAKSKYYDEARKLGQLASKCDCDEDGKRQFVVCSGGGPSMMEAANRGATDVGAESIGLNIVLPHEQAPNEYVTPSLSFQFHYFALRKMHFLIRARAVACFPGGFGTFDEMFELLTLVQTGKMKAVPILLFGEDFWTRVIDFEALAEEGTISPENLNIFRFVDTADEAWEMINDFYVEPIGWKSEPTVLSLD
ncbi:TIGR00730 family Rossman fold protein [Parasphingopyxis sp. CP4]|uniref:LOG family protein n=1 Tax=Parasphingopyxis sp. CP4 TaxID=2724527 RepID=UPI0015A0CCEF|nr:TIGR00730 family Rossman fold protein [Parasphingopyxis sp. CP4]QLC22116.1 TIGR00730 family Rossman fold protein [Parasphingopyxis sp. CP4]